MKPSLLIIILFITLTNPVLAQSGAGKDETTLPEASLVTSQINSRDEGETVSRKLTMVMRDKRGKTRKRETKSYRKYYSEEKRTVIFYLSPKNIKDTAFLTYDYNDPEQEDNQWLYLPALRKVRRISASDRGDYFLGTDLTYEDLKLETRVATDDFNFQTIATCEVNGHSGLKIEGRPKTEDIARELGYSKTLSCVDNKIWMVRQSLFWGVQGKLLKTVTNSNIKQVQGIWTQHNIDVENHKTGHSTALTFSEVNYQNPVVDDIFTTNAIKRGL